MIENAQTFASFAVDDVGEAKKFYEGTLGLEVSEQDGVLWLATAAGDRGVLLYPRPNHTPAAFTVLNFAVDDIDKAVDGLAERGVSFERYGEYEGDEKGIYRDERGAIAWFKDPAENILSIVQEG